MPNIAITSSPFVYVIVFALACAVEASFFFMQAAGPGRSPFWGVASVAAAAVFALAVVCVSIWTGGKGFSFGGLARGVGVAVMLLAVAYFVARFLVQHAAITARV